MATIEKRENGGNLSYRVKVRLKGYPTQTATFKRLTDARKWANQTEASILEGRHFKTVEAKKHTLKEMLVRYKENILPKLKSGKDRLKHINYWIDKIGDYSLSDIRPPLIVECKDELLNQTTNRGAKRSGSTVNRYLATLSHAFSIAVKEWQWVEENPLNKVSKLAEAKGRVRFLSEEERESLLNECKKSENKYLYLIVVLALSTGARKGEIMSLKWEDIDFNRCVATFHDTKNKEIRLAPIKGLALDLMTEHAKVRRITNDYVFPAKIGEKSIDIRTAWENALERAEIKNFRFHDLRHTAASYLAMNGATLAEIAEVLGHKTLQMVKRYAHLSEAHTASVVERMNKKIFG